MSHVGRHIGRYRILEQLGQGGMSVVYKGLDTALDREVAVKVLHPHLAGKEESRKRLAREAKAVARLHHPNILEVFDFAAADASDAYIVTEYIRGKTLRQFLTDEALAPPEIAAMVVHEIAAALAHAHELGVIHRDLKPENVMLREDGLLKLMDFGIAKILDRDEKMTMTGALVGSPAHMAPEIVEGEEAGAEADVFSLGTMLYLFATGRLPFSAANTTATLRKILEGTYDDPRQIVSTVSDELAEIIATCLMRQPKDRYANAGKLRDVLAEYLGGLGLTRVGEELGRFFADPKAYREDLTPRLTTALLARSERLIAEKRPARALASLNLVLAHDPGNQRTLQLLAKLKAHNARQKRVVTSMRLAIALGTLIIVGASVWRGLELARRVEDFREPLLWDPTEIPVLTAGLYPSPPEKKVDPPPALVEPTPTPVVVAPRPIDKPLQLIAVPKPVPKPIEPVVKPVGQVALAAVKVAVAPFGLLGVDGKPPASDDELSQYTLSLPPGRHTLVATCSVCVTKGTTKEITVEAGKENVFAVVVPYQPSQITIDGFPDDALVTIGAKRLTAAELKENQLTVTLAPDRAPVNYEITQGEQLLQKGKLNLVPGKPLIITRGMH